MGSPRGKGTGARKQAHVRRREIADAALKVIAEKGLGRFTSLAIAREVGVTDGALFRHFATKQAIVVAAIDRVEEILFGEALPAGGDPVDRLGVFFLRRIAIIRRNPGVARLVLSEDLARAAPPAAVRRVTAFRERSADFVATSLAEADRRGLLAADVEVGEAQVLVYGALMALAHAPHLAAPGKPADRVAGRVWRQLERVLRHGCR
jgi:AcrR family transcriptional regulator